MWSILMHRVNTCYAENENVVATVLIVLIHSHTLLLFNTLLPMGYVYSKDANTQRDVCASIECVWHSLKANERYNYNTLMLQSVART